MQHKRRCQGALTQAPRVSLGLTRRKGVMRSEGLKPTVRRLICAVLKVPGVDCARESKWCYTTKTLHP